MKRTLILVVLATVAVSVWAVPPAGAAATICPPPEETPQNVVVVEPGQISVYPLNAPGYVAAVVDANVDYLNCTLVRPLVGCAEAIVASPPRVTIDPHTLAITIDTPACPV